MSGGFRGFGSATSQRRSELAPNLGAALGVELWIKRDDCTGLAMGGTRWRQLEFHFGDAQARGADTVLVTGAVQSNLIRIAAAGARRLGLDIHVQLEERVADVGEVYHTSGNVLLDRVLGATLHSFPSARTRRLRTQRWRGARGRLQPRAARRMSFIRPPGIGPLGGIGYVVAAGGDDGAGRGSQPRVRRSSLPVG